MAEATPAQSRLAEIHNALIFAQNRGKDFTVNQLRYERPEGVEEGAPQVVAYRIRGGESEAHVDVEMTAGGKELSLVASKPGGMEVSTTMPMNLENGYSFNRKDWAGPEQMADAILRSADKRLSGD